MNNMQNPGTTSATSQNTTSTATDSAAGTGTTGAAAANPLLNNPQLLSMLSSLSVSFLFF